MSSFLLKLFACTVMLIDHIGFVFQDAGMDHRTYILLRTVGRLAFPIFAFLIAEGCLKTKNMPRYILRLFLAGIISEIAFDLAFFKTPFDIRHQNVMFTFALGVLAVFITQEILRRFKNRSLAIPAGFIAAALCAATGELLRTDYGYQGVLFVYLVWMAGENKWLRCGAAAMGCFLLSFSIAQGSVSFNGLQLYSVLALIPIFLYNGRRGPGGLFAKYGFYLFYPAHLLALYGIRLLW